MLFHCPEQRCCSEFTSSEELQDYVHLGEHSKREVSESLYDSLRHDWAMKFSSLTLESKIATLEVTGKVKSEVCKMGWALQKTRGSGTRFTEKVKEYLSSRWKNRQKSRSRASCSRNERGQRGRWCKKIHQKWVANEELGSQLLFEAFCSKTKKSCNDYEIGLTHPILFDRHNICDHVNHDTLRKFKVTTLREMWAFFWNCFQSQRFKSACL